MLDKGLTTQCLRLVLGKLIVDWKKMGMDNLHVMSNMDNSPFSNYCEGFALATLVGMLTPLLFLQQKGDESEIKVTEIPSRLRDVLTFSKFSRRQIFVCNGTSDKC